jgi:hypothetical protein
MAFKCKIGLHSWNGCKCTDCGIIRDEQHYWLIDCEKCAQCGKTNGNIHKWIGCKCAKCGKIRDEHHEWIDCKCSKCGKINENSHVWNGCKCTKCAKTRDEQHDWTKDCNNCSICGEKRTKMHSWDGDKCSICNKDKETVEVNLNLFDSSTNDWLKILYLFLVNHAQKSKEPTFYEDIAPRMGLNLQNSNEKASFIGALRALAEVDIKAGRPILSLIAVSDNPMDQCMADRGLISFIESKGVIRDSLGFRIDSFYSFSVVFNQYWEERIPIFL